MRARDIEREERFIIIYRAYVDEIYQFICARSGFNPTVAEDITQSTFLDIFKGLNQFKGLCSERTWIYKIARNKLNDFYRVQYGKKFEDCDINAAEALYDPSQQMDLQMEKMFEGHIVHGCLNKLPQHYRIALSMKYVDGRSIKQIAAIAKKSPKAIESLLQRAKLAFIKEYQASKAREEKDNE